MTILILEISIAVVEAFIVGIVVMNVVDLVRLVSFWLMRAKGKAAHSR